MLTARDLCYDIYREPAPRLRVLKKQGQQKVTEPTPLKAKCIASVIMGKRADKGRAYATAGKLFDNGDKLYFVPLWKTAHPLSGEQMGIKACLDKTEEVELKSEAKKSLLITPFVYQDDLEKVADVDVDREPELRIALITEIEKKFPNEAAAKQIEYRLG